MKTSNKILLSGVVGCIAVFLIMGVVFRMNASAEVMKNVDQDNLQHHSSMRHKYKLVEGQVVNLQSFKTISVMGSFNVQIKKGATPKMTILANKQIRKFVQYSIKNGKLKIKTDSKKNSKVPENINIVIQFDGDINQINSMGSNRFDISGLDSKKLSFNLAGRTFHSVLSGKVTDFEINGAGKFDVDAKKLITENTSIAMAGKGKVVVNVQNKLTVAGFGQGEVSYYGNPSHIEKHAFGELTMINKSSAQ